ncbi:MAG: FHA domain-containing protein [Candidatus Ancillula sp.]|jgi:pSer/pThr/pTyr-binding forkhead associated (FHA) protein|nr:FHA domain-containing protein [Candidatus Ancillula sp.]
MNNIFSSAVQNPAPTPDPLTTGKNPTLASNLNAQQSAPTAQSTRVSAKLPVAFLHRRANQEDILISKYEFKLGRDANQVDAVLTGNLLISGFHVVIRYYPQSGFVIEDPGSTNRVRVNELKIAQCQEIPIKNGDCVRIADEYFDFIISEEENLSGQHEVYNANDPDLIPTEQLFVAHQEEMVYNSDMPELQGGESGSARS